MSNLLENDITVDRRVYIIELQGYLRTIQRTRQGSTTVPQDGYFGPDTTAGVREFQREEGLPTTGRVDATTWNAIYQAYEQIMRDTQPPADIRGARRIPLSEGDQGDPVLFLSIMLARLGRVYTNLPETSPDDRYTTATVFAVRDIQEWAGLPISGETDAATWDAVTTLYNALPQEVLFE